MGIIGNKNAKKWAELEKKDIALIIEEINTLNEDIEQIAAALADIEGASKKIRENWKRLTDSVHTLHKSRSKPQKTKAAKLIVEIKEELFPVVVKLRKDLSRLDALSTSLSKAEKHLWSHSFQVDSWAPPDKYSWNNPNRVWRFIAPNEYVDAGYGMIIEFEGEIPFLVNKSNADKVQLVELNERRQPKKTKGILRYKERTELKTGIFYDCEEIKKSYFGGREPYRNHWHSFLHFIVRKE